MNSTTTRDLLLLLSDTQTHSGESLGLTLGMSRAAIWKQIHALQKRGLNISCVHGKGYQLVSPIELLDKEKINSHLGTDIRKTISWHLFDEIDSTNQYLMNHLKENRPDKNKIHVCMAEMQTAGKGRRGRQWVTPYASALALSVLYPFHCGFAGLAGLSLVVGVLIARALKTEGANDIKLKWPNDILWQDRKLAGILIELSGEAEGPCFAVIGIGMNISVTAAQMNEQMKDVHQAWVDLNEITPTAVSRNHLSASLITHLLKGLDRFQSQGLSDFMAEWQTLDYLSGRDVNIEDGQREISGKVTGISEKGDLLLATSTGQVTISVGQISVCAKQ